MEHVIAIRVDRDEGVRWVLDRELVQRLLRELDREVVLEAYAIPSLPVGGEYGGRGPDGLGLILVWPFGEGLSWGGDTMDTIDFALDGQAGVMGHKLVGVQWPLPDGFTDLLFASLSDVTPTPVPPPTATPVLLPPGAIFFEHPKRDLRWDGPDERVHSESEAHCGWPELHEDFGVPRLIAVKDARSYWAWLTVAVPREDGWRWTGYYHGDWQIWQGDDPLTVYVVHGEEQRIAFEYRAHGCD